MKPTLYALLVGINEYLGGVPPLNGCVNDVLRMHEFLRARTGQGDFVYNPRILTSEDCTNPNEIKPTRQAVINGFRSHLAQASEGDLVLFYYSGHGSQEKAPPQFWHIEPDHMDETLVCYDSRTEGGWDLADKELALLIAEVARKNPHIVIILDSCHSGSGTRAPEGMRLRLAPNDPRDRPLDEFLEGVVPAAQARPAVDPSKGSEEASTGEWFTLPQGRHVVIAACRPEESAREKMMPEGQVHGVLSYYLLDTLQQSGPGLSYQDVFNRVKNLVRNTVMEQNPVLAATDLEDLRRTFLGGAIPARREPYFTVSYRKDKGWWLDAGAIHGIAKPVGDETTILSLFPLTAKVEIGDSLEGEVGTARVVEVGGGESRIEIAMDERSMPDQKQTYKAFITSVPLPPLPVHLSGDDQPALEALGQALRGSLIVRETPDISEAVIVVTARQDDHSYRLRRAGDLQPLSVAVPDKGSKASVIMAQSRLEHIAQWTQVLNLENKQSQIPPDAIAVEFYRYDPAAGGGKGQGARVVDPTQMRLSYNPQTGEDAAHLQIRLVNRWKRDLYCMLIDLTDDFAITTDQAFFGDGMWLKPGEEAWAINADGEKSIDFWVPDELRELGVTQVRDTLKLIIGTDESKASYLHQDGLELVQDPQTRGFLKSKGAAQPSTLERLMQRVQTRAGGSRQKDEKLSDFRTAQFAITTTCLGGGVDVPGQTGQEVELAPGVFMQGLPGLQGNARLETLHEGARDIGNLALPAVFRAYPELSAPFDFLSSRGGDAGSSVIVLSEVANREAVTPETPLVIRVEQKLRTDELILPVGYDPETKFYLPLGYSQPAKRGVEIQVHYLPDPTSDSRDVKGSIKLFFQKVVADKLGLAAESTRLAVANVEEDDRVVYDGEPKAVAQRVKNAERILLYIHGFVGDTRAMVRNPRGLSQPDRAPLPALSERYDLILAYDYENIYTPIERTALHLKQQLQEVGLGPNHGKMLHVVAHSMGGLVARWLIEQQGGNQVVQKVVLVGPPNAGTPWAKIQDYALVGLGAALNGLAALAAPLAVVPTLIGALGTVVVGMEKVDTTLDQLKPDSDFYHLLNASDDPGVPYVVIAGDTSKIAHSHPEHQHLLKKLAERLTSPETRNRLLSLAFFSQPNDIAISLKSMTGLPKDRQPEPQVIEVACDHVSYFSTEVGLRSLAEALP